MCCRPAWRLYGKNMHGLTAVKKWWIEILPVGFSPDVQGLVPRFSGHGAKRTPKQRDGWWFEKRVIGSKLSCNCIVSIFLSRP